MMSAYSNFKDHFGVSYQKVNIMSNGLCGFASVSYCVSGNPHAYESVIDDSFNSFQLNQALFQQQTDVGQSTSLNAYKEQMRIALRNVRAGKSLPEALWLEDGHLVTYSLMYDVSIFVYNQRLHEWYVYNDKGRRGYVCLAFSGSHYDVLLGLSGAPTIPREVKRRGLDRLSLNWSEVPVDPRKYSFDFVWKWPNKQPEINLVNELIQPASNVIVTEKVGGSLTSLQCNAVSSKCFAKNTNKAETLKCTVCDWIPKKASNAALRMHHKRCHSDLTEVTSNLSAVVSNSDSLVKLTLNNSEQILSASLSSNNESICSAIHQSIDEPLNSDSSMSSTHSNSSGSWVTNFALKYKLKTFDCPVEGCTSGSFKNKAALRMHTLRCHKHSSKVIKNVDTNELNQNCLWEQPSLANNNSEPLSILESDNESIISASQQSAESFDSDTSTRSTRSASKCLADGSILFKAPLPKAREDKCEGCGKTFQRLSRHLKFCKKIPITSVELDVCQSSSVDGEKCVTVNSIESDNESIISASQLSGESFDSDSSAHSTRSTSILLADSSILFKAPLPKTGEDKCEGCGQNFQRLSRHLKFCKKLSVMSVEFDASQSSSVPEGEHVSAENSISIRKKEKGKNQQCLSCLMYFVNLSQHKRCKGAPGYVSVSRERKRLATASLSSMPSVNSDVEGRSSRASSAFLSDVEDRSSRASSVSSQSSAKSTKSGTKNIKSLQGVVSQSEMRDSVVISDCSESSRNLLSDTESVFQNNNTSTNVKTKSVNAIKRRKEGDKRRTGQFVCDVCSKKCRTKASLNRHSLSAHANNVPLIDNASETVLNSDCEISNSNVDSPENVPQSGKTRKTRLESDFESKLAALKKEYLSSEVVQIDPLYDALKLYQQDLTSKLNNVTTERLSDEILAVIANPDEIGDDRKFTWTEAEQQRLNELNIECKELKLRSDWYWSPEPGSPQAIYNEKRLELCMNEELKYEIVHCKGCKTDSLMVGVDQVGSDGNCYECLLLRGKKGGKENSAKVKEKISAWEKIRPASRIFPKRVEPGHTDEDLPYLYPGSAACISLTHPVVTIKKAYFRNKKLRQESITVLGRPGDNWVKILPRDNLKDRFFVLERTSKNGTVKRHIVANRDHVEQWLRYLFVNHKEYKRRLESGELEISSDALDSLERQSELASVDTVNCEDDMTQDSIDIGIVQPSMQSGFVDHHILALDKYPNLYLKKNDFIKIKQAGKIEIIQEECRLRPIYSASANLSFPHLFPNGEMCPTDFGSYVLAKDLLKKQMMFAYKDSQGKLRWIYAAEDIYIMHQYARLTEMRVHARVGFYISQHPSTAHLPLESVINAFKQGFDETGVLDSCLPDLTMIMTQIPHSRQFWFQERQGLEAIARDLSDPNLFMTINPEPRHSPDIRELIHSLHFPNEPFDREWTFSSTEQFTELMSRYAPHVSVYLWRKTKIFMRAFLNDICRIPESDSSEDWTKIDKTKNGYYFFRSEFTESRGFAHFHFMVRLPNTLEAGALSRMVHNMRVVRQELKCGNVHPAKKEAAFQIIRFGLLASRYLVLLADSVSCASFYTEQVSSFEVPDPSKVIDVDALRTEFENRCKTGSHTVATHPLMRKFDDPECDSNPFIDYAQVVAATCIHNCLVNGTCGGSPISNSGCRFSYPKKIMPCTVPAVMQVTSQQSEVNMILRRTHARVCTSNFYITRHLRCNNDLQLIPDPATSLRYCLKYCTKSAKHDVLLNEMVDHINSRTGDIFQPTVNEALSHLMLADCSHHQYLSVHELCWYVMQLPNVCKSYSKVDTVAFHPRANLSLSYGDNNTISYSDRTSYSAYAERCNESTEIKCPRGAKRLDAVQMRDEVAKMSLREFAERITHTWKLKDGFTAQDIDAQCKRKFTNRDVNSGHWVLAYNKTRKHIRSSIRLYTRPAIEYEAIDVDECTSQTAFFDLPREKRQQLLRSYQELVFYVPWRKSPDESFLNEEQRNALNDDPERDRRYSLRRLQAFFRVYQAKWAETFRPRSGTPIDEQTQTRNELWFRDCQYSYSMYLANDQNSDLRLDRIANKGVLTASYDDADELQGTSVNIQPSLHTENDDAEYPSVLNFCIPNDGFREIMHQEIPQLSEIRVTFPLQHAWQTLEDSVRKDKVKMFMARPPLSPINESQMTDMQRFAYECMLDDSLRVVYIVGRAGSGKTICALLAAEKLKGRVQCMAGTGRAASNFNGPTIHSALSWSLRGNSDSSGHSAKKIGEMRAFYEKTDIFIVDEINAVSAETLARMHDTLTSIFNPDMKKTSDGQLIPFAGKKLIFLGDPAQLRPVLGSPIYEANVAVTAVSKQGASRQKSMNVKGQWLYRNYLLPNTILLQKGQRNAGLLQIICDRLRDGKQTSDDLAKLTWLKRKFPDAVPDFGIHYDNDSCNKHNLWQLWNDCRSESSRRRLYVCKATYEDTGNQSVVDGLASLPAKFFDYVPNILCLSEMCLVRITKNINVGSGLVNGSVGRVIQILFDNADVPALLQGEHPPPHCVIVEFEDFQGFVLDSNKPDERFFPIEGHNDWVPIYREKIHPNVVNIPSWIRKKQTAYQCYRQQFPLDLAMHMTAHRSQGQTLGDVVVSADMNLDNPDMFTPVDIGSVLYVGLTRVCHLRNLMVSPIFPSTWEKIGKSEMDDRRRKADLDLLKASERFAIGRGKYDEYRAELNFKPDHGDIEQEWNHIKCMTSAPERKRPIATPIQQSEALDVRFTIRVAGETTSHPLCLTPVLSERHIGIDQGRKNFAIVCVDKCGQSLLRVVAAQLYHLNLPRNFKMIDLACALTEHTDLLKWMQCEETMLLEPVDRVVVHVEQMSVENGNCREFTIGLGKYLQSRVIDINTTIVKLSQANIHRRNGPMFKLGDDIVKSLSISPSDYQSKKKDFIRKRPAVDVPKCDRSCTCNGRVTKKCKARKHRKVVCEQDLTDDVTQIEHVNGNQLNVHVVTAKSEQVEGCKVEDEYTRKKKMSSAIYRYFVHASAEQQLEMGVQIDEVIQEDGKKLISHLGRKAKLDDLGDALLHSLNELLCGSTNYRQLVPASSSIANNRTVVIAVLPHTTYWIVLNCQFNLFALEDLGCYDSDLEGKFFRSGEVEKLILSKLSDGLRAALTDFSGGSILEKVDNIKIVVKQLQGLEKYALTRAQAGSLTQTTYSALKLLVDSVSPADSKLLEKKDKNGHCYVRTDSASGHAYHVLKSSGKHLNAVLCFLDWFKENANRVLEKRDADLNQGEKLRFFKTLESLAEQDEPRLEMMRLSEVVKGKLSSGMFRDKENKKVLADLILISINKNQGHVKAIAANYRANLVAKKPRVRRSKAVESECSAIASDAQQDQGKVIEAVDNEQCSDVEPD